MATLPKHTFEEVLAAVEAGETLKGTAEALRVSRQTVYAYAQRWPEVQAALADKRSELVDLAERALRQALVTGQPWAVSMVLRTLGKDQGYSTRQEHTGRDGGPIEIREMVVRLPEGE